MMDRPQHGAMEGLYIQKEQAEIRVKRNRNKALSAKSLRLPVFPQPCGSVCRAVRKHSPGQDFAVRVAFFCYC